MTGAGMMTVQRSDQDTRDEDLIAGLIRETFCFQHSGRYRCTDPAGARAQLRSAGAGGLVAGTVRYDGFECTARVEPVTLPSVVTVTAGRGSLSTAGEQLNCVPGDVFMPPGDQLHTAAVDSAAHTSLQVPWSAIAALAQEQTGLPVADLRFTAIAPVSARQGRAMAGTSGYICDELITSGAAEVHPLMVQELTRMAATAMLAAFPNTTMTAAYLPGPGWAPPAAVRRAIAYMRAHADQPITLTEIAAAAGLTGQALQHAFGRQFGTSTSGYLRRIRLERAYQDLAGGDPAQTVTVAAVARHWGWVSERTFTVAYRQRFGVLPSDTLRHR